MLGTINATRMFVLVLTLVLAVVVYGQSPSTGQSAPIDPATGLVMDENWQLVAAHCGACHSNRLVTQNRGSRETWLALIRWMQETQGLWPFDEQTENILLDYLAANYGPMDVSRRAPLPEALMPPNPTAKH